MKSRAILLGAVCAAFVARVGAAQTCPCPGQSGTNYRSIGTNGGILHSGVGEASVGAGGSLVTFLTPDLPVDVVGVGDQITLDPGGGNQEILYIRAVNAGTVLVQGTAGPAHTNENYEIRRAYTTLPTWESARDGDLVGENRTEVGVAYKDATDFTGTLTIDASSSSAGNYMHLTVAQGHGHNGIAGVGVLLDGMGGNGIDVLENFTRVEGLELANHTAERAILLSGAATNLLLDRLLIHDAAFGFKAEGGTSFTLRNSIVYDSAEAVHDEGTTATIENCTFYNIALTDGAVKEDGGTYTVINSISMDNGGQDFKDITTQINNMSSDASAVGYPSRSSAAQFVSTAGKNFHLIVGSEAIDNAGTRSFCCDVDNQPRGAAWDIGADEFKPNTNYRSIGNAADYITGNIVATDGWPVVTGIGTSWWTANRGRGDRIDIGGTDYTVLSVDSDTQLTLTTPVSGGDYNGGYTISRQFKSLATGLQDWEDCISFAAVCPYFTVASANLINDDRSEVGIVYEDGVFTNGLAFQGSTTDTSHDITLTADGDNRHYGIIGQGVVLDNGANGADAVLIEDDFVTVEWLEITGGGAEGITVSSIGATSHVVVRNCLLQNVANGDNIFINSSDVVIDVYNNFLYKPEEGIRVGATLNAGTDIRILNNTIYDAADKGIISTATPNTRITLSNNLVHTTAGNNYGVSAPINAASINNMGDDGTGATHNGFDTAQSAAATFVSPGTGDLHILPGSDAANAGADLSAIFGFDIDAGIRQTLWDIGADDIVAATAVELVSFTAVSEGGRVAVEWETASELDNLGFHVYRSSTRDGPFERLTSWLIPGLGSSPAGASYRYVDESVVSGETYYYELEDIETTGAIERHGPVSVSVIEAAEGTEVEEATQIGYGTPEANGVRVVKRTAGYVVLELTTSGFFAEPREDGSVTLSVPGFDDSDGLPVKRAWVDAVEGRDVVLKRAWTRDVRAFSSLRPGARETELVATADGGVRLRQKDVKRIEAATTRAELLHVAIQGERKKALVELSPFHWNGNELSVATRLYVRLSFKKQKGKASARRVAKVRRLTTQEAGLYAYPLRTRTTHLGLSRQGEYVPHHVEADTLFFLGEGDGAVYELEEGVPGTAMSIVEPAAEGPATDVMWHTERREESLLYQAGLVERDDPWLWDALFAPATTSYSFDVTGLAPGPAYVRVWLQGTSDFTTEEDHHVRVSVNGFFVAEERWDGKRAVELDGELPPGTLRDGKNSLEVESVADTEASYSFVLLDAFEVDYRRLGNDGQTHGVWHDSATVAASWVVDTTEEAPRWVSGFSVEEGHSYVVATEAYTPEVSRVDRSRLLRKRRADWLLIGPRSFLEAAKPLISHRRSQGLKVQAVATEEIYAAFGGEAGPEAIREFLRYAYHEWRKPSYRYVVLLGDGTYDPEDHLQTGTVDHVPPYMVRTNYLWTASDPAYASVNGDDLMPDVAIGRLPAASIDDVRILVEKILAYEHLGPTNAPVVFVADNADKAGDFESHALELGDSVFANATKKNIFLSRLGADGARNEVKASLDDGASLVSYIGHGAIHLWANESIFGSSDVSALATQSKQPLLLTMNCLNGLFHFPYFDALAEAMVKAEGKGAIAAFSAAGLSLDGPAHRYHAILLEEMVRGGHRRVGDAVLRAQERFADTGAMPELLLIYHLFGDPALPLMIHQ